MHGNCMLTSPSLFSVICPPGCIGSRYLLPHGPSQLRRLSGLPSACRPLSPLLPLPFAVSTPPLNGVVPPPRPDPRSSLCSVCRHPHQPLGLCGPLTAPPRVYLPAAPLLPQTPLFLAPH
jgi:hypothetical protein